MERYVGIGWLSQLGWPRFVGRLAGLVGSNLLETHKISVFLIKNHHDAHNIGLNSLE